MSSLELQLKCARGSLKLIRKDLCQIYNVGVSIIEKSETNLRNSFLSMYPTASDLKTKYMNEFTTTFNLAITGGQESLFPTDEDTKQRNEINSLSYKIVEFYQSISNQNDTKLSAPCTDTGSFNKSMLNQSLARSRLPKVELPKFSGHIVDWPKFKQLFESIIHNNHDIPTIEKYHYLCTTVIGEAKSLIAPFSVNEDNYPKAWEALCKRFDNRRLLATTYFDTIMDFSVLKGTPTLASLQSFITSVAESVAALKSINIDDEADFIWLTLALRKLDHDTRKQFENSVVDKEWPTFASLIEFVYGRCRVLQLSECTLSSGSSKPFKTSVKPHILATTTSVPTTANKPVCRCHPSHQLYQCPTFRSKSPNSRKSFLKGKIVCFNCLRPGHISSNCTSSGRCRTCQGRHHTLLHHSKPSLGTDISPGPCSPHSSTSLQVESSCDDMKPTVVASVTGPTQVILGTAEAFILDHQGQCHAIRLLVDCGSQFSLITSDCAKRLGLAWYPSKYRPFGAGETPLPRVKGKLKCQLKSRVFPEKFFHVEPLVVSTITGTLPSTSLSPIPRSHLEFGSLADPMFWKPRPIDFLLGGDLFMSIVTGAPRNLYGNYDTLPTVFGLVVMGITLPHSSSPSSLHCHCLTDAPISDEVLVRFWETEDVAMEDNL